LTGAFFETVDDRIYAQPLYLPQVEIRGNPYNVVYVATEDNKVYAFDADNGGSALWQENLTPSNGVPVNEYNDLGACTNINPTGTSYNVGITGTPVIDISANSSRTMITTGTLYVVAASVSPSSCANALATGCTFLQTLYALDVTFGAVIASTNITPSASAWDNNDNPIVLPFNAQYANQRGALLFQKDQESTGHVYIPFGSHCDQGPWAGWLVSYTLSGSGFSSPTSWLIDPQQDSTGYNRGSIWGGWQRPGRRWHEYLYSDRQWLVHNPR
jgi:hypothetical protein